MDISQITDYLFVGSQPDVNHADQLRRLGVRLIITLRARRPALVFGTPPLQVLWVRAIDSPMTPISMKSFVRGVEAAQAVIQDGGRVFVHCRHGRHRSVAMAAAILIAQGDTAAEAMRRLSVGRARADPQIWYIRQQILRFEKYWRGREATPARD